MIPGAGPFTQALRERAQSLFDLFIHHPFQTQLRAGTLLPAVFGHYLTQDALYLKENAKAFTIVSERFSHSPLFSPNHKQPNRLELYKNATRFFNQMAVDSYAMEREMQSLFFRTYSLKPATEQSEACEGYTRFLIQHANDSPLPVAVAALLPCFWIYQETSSQKTVLQNPYHLWLSTYSGDIYLEYTHRCILILEQLMALELSSPVIREVENVFLLAAEWECRLLDESL